MLEGGTQLLKSRQVNCKDGITNVQSDYTYNPLPTDLFVVPNHEFDLFCAIFSVYIIYMAFIYEAMWLTVYRDDRTKSGLCSSRA